MVKELMTVRQMKFVPHVSVPCMHYAGLALCDECLLFPVTQLGMITEATGSAYIEMCKTKVVCAV